MKRLYAILCAGIICTSIVSCSSNNDTPAVQPEDSGITAIFPPTGVFAEDDGSAKPGDNPAKNVSDYLTKTGPQAIKGLGSLPITDEQYQEIKTFTTDLVKDDKSDKDKYNRIFTWITQNINYQHEGYVDNDPYPVFKERYAVCQGYANLLTVMLQSQGIPAVNVNGDLKPIGGHAWNYLYADQWYVSDPTNGGSFPMSDFSKYSHLVPTMLDMTLFEDENFAFNYYDGHLNLCEVKQSGKQLTVPFSTNGFRVTSFNPNADLPSNIEELYIGKNILTLGESLVGLSIHSPSVKYAYVDSKNAKIYSYAQVVYRYNNPEPLYIPAAATVIQLKGLTKLGKNSLKNHTNVEILVIPQGTETIGAFAVENCPNLKKAYIPKNAKVETDAFYGVHSDFRIIRQ